MREGFYRLEYAGSQGAGFGLIVLDTNQVIGCDLSGGVFRGSYQWNTQTQQFDVDATFTATNPVQLVQGISLQPGQQFSIKTSFSKDANGEVVPVQTNFGPVNARMTLIEPMP